VIIFWILTLFVGSSAFAFAYIYLQYDILWSLGYVLIAVLICRGILNIGRRWLILREHVFGDLRSATAIACRMVGTIGMGPDKLDPQMSAKAANFCEQLISVADITQGAHAQGRGSAQWSTTREGSAWSPGCWVPNISMTGS
jgi:hypothetical protein